MKARISRELNRFFKHEFIRDTLSQKYILCKSCNLRTQFTCVTCGFCWSCHWKIDELSKVPSVFLDNSVKD